MLYLFSLSVSDTYKTFSLFSVSFFWHTAKHQLYICIAINHCYSLTAKSCQAMSDYSIIILLTTCTTIKLTTNFELTTPQSNEANFLSRSHITGPFHCNTFLRQGPDRMNYKSFFRLFLISLSVPTLQWKTGEGGGQWAPWSALQTSRRDSGFLISQLICRRGIIWDSGGRIIDWLTGTVAAACIFHPLATWHKISCRHKHKSANACSNAKKKKFKVNFQMSR